MVERGVNETTLIPPGRLPFDPYRPGSLISTADLQPDDVSTMLERFIAVPAATRSGGIPATGWARLAMVLHPLYGTHDALVLADLDEGSTVLVDWGRKHYWWRGAAVVPNAPTIANVRLFRGEGARLPYMLEQPDDLSTLLWHIGINAFPHSPAWWLAEGQRYQLSRWPDFTSFAHDPEQVRMTALLGTGPFTAPELAAAAGVDPIDTQRLINALSLMGLLRETPIELGEAPPAPVQRPRGLFSRLRSRWGRD